MFCFRMFVKLALFCLYFIVSCTSCCIAQLVDCTVVSHNLYIAALELVLQLYADFCAAPIVVFTLVSHLYCNLYCILCILPMVVLQHPSLCCTCVALVLQHRVTLVPASPLQWSLIGSDWRGTPQWSSSLTWQVDKYDYKHRKNCEYCPVSQLIVR